MAKILLVEDTLDLARAIQRDLEDEGYTVFHAPEGHQALHLFQQHTPPGGIVAVFLSNIDVWIQVEVRDIGEEIPSEDLALIWERFYRGSLGSPSQGSGAGLGLALVKELTEAMCGTAAVQSTLGEGSIFTVKLPKART